MSEFFTVRTPSDAWKLLLQHFTPRVRTEQIATADALDRVLASSLISPQDLPEFARSTVDGYAVNAVDTYGASSSLPAFLTVIGEVAMGRASELRMGVGEAALVHTGGMIPAGANGVVMVENTQVVDAASIEVLRPVAEGENVIQIGEDIRAGEPILGAGRRLRPQEIGGLLALGITTVTVAVPPRVAIISSGDEVVAPDQPVAPGQVRDINSYTLAGLTRRAGGEPILYGIVPDDRAALEAAAAQAHAEADIVVLSAGSSVSYRDLSVEVIAGLGAPGVLVHGLSVRPGKPTIVAVADGKPVFGLPGNPVSAMVIFDLIVAPTIRALLGAQEQPKAQMQARLARNIASTAGREDYVQVRLEEREGEVWAVPVLGKSNLIYTLVHADGTVKIDLNANGIREGAWVTVLLH
ncbi:MAG: molybdopterin molybdenumtransferase MoeA [Chloroflexi bacterium]|nr:MAG: molybdopterin molybdenumtransferase MoeA [Chloroflexota bacterium]